MNEPSSQPPSPSPPVAGVLLIAAASVRSPALRYLLQALPPLETTVVIALGEVPAEADTLPLGEETVGGWRAAPLHEGDRARAGHVYLIGKTPVALRDGRWRLQPEAGGEPTAVLARSLGGRGARAAVFLDGEQSRLGEAAELLRRNRVPVLLGDARGEDALALEQLPQALAKRLPAAPPPQEEPAELEPFIAWLQERSGHDLDAYKREGLLRRLVRHLQRLSIDSLEHYRERLAHDAEAMAQLQADLLIGVTAFFRDPEAWQTLARRVIAPLTAEADAAPLRVWVAGCATGEEAYTAAILIKDALAAHGSTRELQLFASDVRPAAIATARCGRYPAKSLEPVPDDARRRWFTAAGPGLVEVTPELRESVVFARHDLLRDPPFAQLDLVICRNLLIYLNPEGQERCLRTLHFALRPQGHLMLGCTETIGLLGDLFTAADRQMRIFRRIGTPHLPVIAARGDARDEPAPVVVPTASPGLTDAGAEQALLAHFAPPSVLVDERYDVVFFHGDTRTFLKQPPGLPTQNVLRMVPEALLPRLRSALFSAVRGRGASLFEYTFGSGEEAQQVSVRVEPLRSAAGSEPLYLVAFEPLGGAAVQRTTGEDGLVEQLEYELATTRAELQERITELAALNSRLRRANEELQVSNAELEASREELQSVNEELLSVNTEVNEKAAELERAHDDLTNFIENSDVPTLFLDRSLALRRFTPAMNTLLKLRPGDEGRPLTDFSLAALGDDLVIDTQQVLSRSQPVARDVQGPGRRWYTRRVLPYRGRERDLAGVVITFADVSELKRAQHALSEARDTLEAQVQARTAALSQANEELELHRGRLEERVQARTAEMQQARTEAENRAREAEEAERQLNAIMACIPEALAIADQELNITRASRYVSRLTGSPELRIDESGSGSADLCRLLRLDGSVPPPDALPLVRAVRRGLTVSGEEWLLERRDGTTRAVSAEAGPILDGDGRVVGGVIAWRDVTAQKAAAEAHRRQREFLEQLMEASPIGIAVVRGRDYRFEYVNPAYQQVPGRVRTPKPGRTVAEVLRPEFAGSAVQALDRVYREGRALPLRDIEIKGSDGSSYWDVELTPLFGPVNAPDGVLVLAREVTEHVEARRRAERIAARDDAILRSLTDGLAVSDAEGNIVSMNPAAVRMHGFRDEADARVNLRYYAENFILVTLEGQEVPLERWPLARALTGESFSGMQVEVRRRDGALRWVADYGGTPVYDSEGRLIYAVVTVRDVTGVYDSQRALRRSEEQLRLAVHNAKLMLYICDRDLRYTSIVNPHPDFPPERVIGRTDEEVLGEKAAALSALKQRVLESGNSDSIEFSMITSRGQEVWQVAAEPLREADGRISGLSVATLDVTETRRAADALHASEQRMRLAVENYPSPFFIYDRDLRVVNVNRAGTEALARPREAILGRRDEELLPERTTRHYLAALKMAAESGEPQTLEVELPLPSGGIRGLVLNYVPLHDGEGNLLQVLGITHDITETIRAKMAIEALNTDLRRRAAELRNSNRELESFAYSVSHDLRAPLRSINGFSQILMEEYGGQLDEEGKGHLRRIGDSAVRMARLIDALLQLSRITRQELHRETVDLSAMARRIAARHPRTGAGKEVTYRIADGLVAGGDPLMVSAAVDNLMQNALKFAAESPSPTIEVGRETQDEQSVFFVRDNGVGFDMAYANKLFQPFHRLHDDARYPGTGIGLAIVKRIIERHGGSVWAEGVPGEGAVFFFTLEP